VHFVISLEDDADPARVSDELARAGLVNAEMLGELLLVTGEAPVEQMERLRMVQGVRAVEPTNEVQLPPPDDPLQ
jgi:hypothetical protein